MQMREVKPCTTPVPDSCKFLHPWSFFRLAADLTLPYMNPTPHTHTHTYTHTHTHTQRGGQIVHPSSTPTRRLPRPKRGRSTCTSRRSSPLHSSTSAQTPHQAGMSTLHQQQKCRNWRRLPISFLLPILLVFLHALPLTAAHGGSEADAQAPIDAYPNLRSKSLILVKIYCLIIVFFATFVAGVSPYFCRWNHSFLVLGTQFAAGVFLGTAMMHFLSDSSSTFDTLTDKDYPFAFMLACAGYVLTMFGDCIIQHIFAKQSNNTRKVDVEMASPKVPPVVHNEEDAACKCDDVISHETKNLVAATLVTKASYTDTLLLILALCFHSVFEGIAIGVAQNADDAWRALWTISLHKIFAAIAMGIALLGLLPDRPLLQTVIYSFAFGISSPIGVAIGIIIDATTQGRVADWMYAIAMGVACGVFIYVAINHLVAKGYVPQCKLRVDTPFYRFLAFTLGVAVLAVVMEWD